MEEWEQSFKLVKCRPSDVELKDAVEGQVVTRFPPEPSGYLHIGHAKAACMNAYFAQRYKGKLIVRFDDTNTAKATQNFEDAIIEDLKRLKVIPDKLEYTSDYFDRLLEFAEQFILAGKAYADNSTSEDMKKQREKFQPSPCRDQSVEENQRIWKEMVAGTELGQQYVLRAKIDYRNKTGSLRDPVMYRSKEEVHHRTGDKFKVFPTYDYSCPIVDSLEGVTHALRSIEYSDRKAQYKWMCKAAGLRVPNVWEFARLDFVRTILSKRKLQEIVDTGVVEGWHDPRFPTIQGVMRRGMTVQGLRAYIMSQGASRNNTMQQWDKIWTVNKRVIDPIAPRHVGIDKANAKRVTVTNGTDEIKIMPRHKKNSSLGTKSVILSKNLLIDGIDADTLEVDEIVTFMDWGNFKIMERDEKGNLTAEFLPDNKDFKKTKKVTWLADVSDLVPMKVLKYSHLLTQDRLDSAQSKTISEFVNYDSLETQNLVGDINMRLLQSDDLIQLERRGYYRCDSVRARDGADGFITLIEIPDGKVAKK